MKIILIGICISLIASCSVPKTEALIQLRSLKAEEYFSSGLQLQLVEAAAKGDIARIDEAVLRGAKVNAIGKEQMTPLMWSLVKRSEVGYSRLLEQGADPNFLTRSSSKYDQGRSVMMIAAICESPEFLRLALNHRGNPNAPSWVPSQTIIFEAVDNKRLDNIKMIHGYGGDLNKRDRRGVTPIIEATYASNYDVVYELLLLGANPSIKNNSGGDVPAILQKYQDRAAFAFGDSRQKVWYSKVVAELQRRGLLK